MFIRKSAFDNLVKRCESQQQQIGNLSEMLGILAQSLGQKFEFNGWRISHFLGQDKFLYLCL